MSPFTYHPAMTSGLLIFAAICPATPMDAQTRLDLIALSVVAYLINMYTATYPRLRDWLQLLSRRYLLQLACGATIMFVALVAVAITRPFV